MNWFRWHHGAVADPKWRVVAAESGQPVHAVVALFALMLETASQSEPRGALTGWRDRVAAAALDLSPEAVQAIREAMQDLVLDGEHLTGWEKRQPKREDGSAERARAWREAKKQERTHPNAPERNRTPEQSRTEQSRTEQKEDPSGSMSDSDEPNADASAPTEANQVRGVFDYWRERSGHVKASLTDERRKKIRTRLKRFGVDDLKNAIDGACSNPYFIGDNEQGQRYDWPETIFKSDSTTEKHIAYRANGNGRRSHETPEERGQREFEEFLATEEVV